MRVVAACLPRLAYQGSLTAARAFGETLRAAVDLTRFRLYDELRLPQAADIADEHRLNSELTKHLRSNYPWQHRYRHPPTSAPPQADADA